jgi:hypothetical protein
MWLLLYCFPVNCTVQVSSPAATPQTEDIVQESLAKGRKALLSPTEQYVFLLFYILGNS